MIRISVTILIFISTFISAQVPDGLLSNIQKDELLSEGGSDLIEWNSDSTYIVGVSAVEVKKKKRNMLRRIGATKAKSQVTQFIEGSDLKTSREMKTQEKVEIQNGKETITFSEEYLEIIQEDVAGFVRGMSDVGGWYSDDKSVYYHAVARLIKQ